MTTVQTRSVTQGQRQHKTADDQSEVDAEANVEDCTIVRVNPPDDLGADIGTWMEALGATIADVAANGQCGWLAYYASCQNTAEGVLQPTTEAAAAANLLKKQVLNGMLANLTNEAALDVENFKAELRASERSMPEAGDLALAMGELADHYVEQRQQSVKASVPPNFWVRTEQLKAMARHSRQPIFVLDATTKRSPRLQVYAYRDVLLDNGELVETGTVTTMTTERAIQLLRELTDDGILPRVMVLNWRTIGNHFQAAVYEQERYDWYMDQAQVLIDKRNETLAKWGFGQMGKVPYNEAATSKTATRELKAIRRKAKSKREEGKQEEDVHEKQDAPAEGAPEIAQDTQRQDSQEGEEEPANQVVTPNGHVASAIATSPVPPRGTAGISIKEHLRKEMTATHSAEQTADTRAQEGTVMTTTDKDQEAMVGEVLLATDDGVDS